jgi:hypothetical protein
MRVWEGESDEPQSPAAPADDRIDDQVNLIYAKYSPRGMEMPVSRDIGRTADSNPSVRRFAGPFSSSSLAPVSVRRADVAIGLCCREWGQDLGCL